MSGGSVVAWVESPLQLLGAAEWAAARSERIDLAARVTEQIPETADEIIRRGARFAEKQPYFGIPWRMLAGHSHWLVGDGFSGQFRMAAAVLRPRRVTFLDDGLNTLALADAVAGTRPYRRPGVAEKGLTTRIAPLVLDHVRARALDGAVDLFTAFALGADRESAIAEYGLTAMRHDFEWLRSTQPTDRLAGRIRTDRILLGSARPRDGLMPTSTYLAWLESEAAHGEATYLPHRRETAEMLDAVRAVTGIRVVETGVPVELALAGLGRPVEVRSLLSSTLTTLPLVLRGTGSRVTEVRLDDILTATGERRG